MSTAGSFAPTSGGWYSAPGGSRADGGTSCARGGWRYSAFDGAGVVGDNSVSQWATLALEYAHHPLYDYEIAIPAWVMTEVRAWVTCIQNHGGGTTDGGAGYTDGVNWVNSYKTGALIQQGSFLGDTATTPSMLAAQAYLQRMWTSPADPGWRSPPVSDYLAIYSIMKGIESMAIDQLVTIDWYR